jgi:hypothetical protein
MKKQLITVQEGLSLAQPSSFFRCLFVVVVVVVVVVPKTTLYLYYGRVVVGQILVVKSKPLCWHYKTGNTKCG